MTVVAEHGPAVLPFHGHQIWDATDRAVVLEHIGIPLAVRGVDQSALGHALVLQGDPALVWPGDSVGAVDQHGAHATLRPGDVEDVVFAVVEAQTAGPRALAIRVLAVFQGQLVTVAKSLITVAD